MKMQAFTKNKIPPVKIRTMLAYPNALRITARINGIFKEAKFANDILLPFEIKHDFTSSCFSKVDCNESSGLIDIVHNNRDLKIKISPDKCSLRIFTHADEGFYGFGEWFNGFRRTDGSLVIHNQESPAFLQHKQTYSAFPCFLSDRNYMIFILNAHKAKVRINKRRKTLDLDFSSGALDFFIISGENFKEMITTYTNLTGRPPLLPLWSFGLWNTAYPVENQSQTISRIKQHRQKEIPLDAVILDYHWQDGFSNFRWRKTVFPDPDAMLKEMANDGIKAGLIYTPYINCSSYPLYKFLVRLYVKNAPDGVPVTSGDYASDVYEEGISKGFFAHDNVTWWLGRGGAVDFTNEQACDWWFDKQKPLLNQGVYFFKNDGAEYLPKGSISWAGLDDEEYHNIYCFYYTKALFERLQKYHGDKRALVFSRTNWAGTQRYPGIFLGDQTPEFKHIAAAMRCGLNMSLLGYSYWGADVLSLYKKPSEELHLRYSQFSIFSPISRYFSNPDDPDRNPWGINSRCEENFRKHINLKIMLLPYYYRLAREAYDTGIPIIRPLFLEFPDDPHTRDIWQQAMIGDVLMMAPVIETQVESIKVYFPKGSWYSWWDTCSYNGPGWYDVKVNDEHLPLFVRGGNPVITGKVMQFIPEDHRFDDIAIHAFPPYNGEAVLYEDDCTTMSYQKGNCSFSRFVFSMESSSKITIKAEAADGKFNSMPVDRTCRIVLHNYPDVDFSITINGKPFTDAVYDKDSRSLTIKTTLKTDKAFIIRIGN